MGMKNDKNSKDLTEAEGIKKWQEYTKELYQREKKRVLMTWITNDGMVTHLEPDILEYEIKWVLEVFIQTKLVEVTESQLSYLKS